jgi:diadenosine tetraphosphate (Ap4A) HIT family hydrolase
MGAASCVSCATLAGARHPPGGVLYDDTHWVVFLRARPLLAPGQGFIVLKRHCEHLSQLTPAELAALGGVMHHTQCAYDLALQPAKVHFGLYAESVRHLHLHIMPRMPGMPERKACLDNGCRLEVTEED